MFACEWISTSLIQILDPGNATYCMHYCDVFHRGAGGERSLDCDMK
jgi:hypothetical protein